jgi:predicted amidohydrolase
MNRPALLLLAFLAACGSARTWRVVAEAPKPNQVPVAVVHLKSINGSIDTREQGCELLSKNFDEGERLVRYAAGQGAKVVVMPEYNLAGVRVHRYERKWVSTTLPKAPTERPLWEYRIPGLAPAAVDSARLAHELGIYLVTNVLEADSWVEEPTFYNTLAVFDPEGRLVTAYRKINLYLWEWLIEVPGNSEGYFDTPWGRFGLLLCLDAIVPWTVSALREKHGCDYLIASTLWEQIPGTGHVSMNALADFSGAPVLWANQPRAPFAGGCGVFLPDAPNSTMGVFSSPGVLIANVPIAKQTAPGVTVAATR